MKMDCYYNDNIILIYVGSNFTVYFFVCVFRCLPNSKQEMHGLVPKGKNEPKENQ